MIKYRKAEIGDAKGISKVLMKNFNVNSEKEGMAIFERERKKDNFIVAENKGKVLGIISWDMHGLPKHQLVRIERLAVSKLLNKMEVAEELVRLATDEADKFFKKKKLKLRKAYAMVHSTNKRMLRMYEKLGFIEEARLKDHYYKGIDDFLLSLFFE